MEEIGSTETLEPSALGLGALGSVGLPFEFRPGMRPSPLVVSFPHVGLDWPASLGSRPQVNFPRNADYAIDRLYLRAEALGAATLRARYSRLVVDLNRAEDDVSSKLVPDHPDPRPRGSLGAAPKGGRPAIRNRGVVWRSAVGNIPLVDTLSYAALEQRIAAFHRPYYRALQILLERRRRRYGYAILLDAHSMPGSVTGDLILGTRAGQTCSARVCELAREVLGGRSRRLRERFTGRWPLSVSIDDPYQGGNIISTFGRPTDEVHALQLEVNRALYMDEYRLEPAPLPSLRDGWVGEPPSSLGPPRGAQGQQRLHALVGALDALVLELSRERDDLAFGSGRSAAE